ncbi:MAG: HAD family hydrolase [Candidatus Heimdallarchaeaceae archaeon]
MSEETLTIPVFMDFSGTLVDTIEITRRVFSEALGKKFTSEQIKQLYKDATKRRTPMYLFFKYPVNPIRLLLNKRKMRKLQEKYFFTDLQLHAGIKDVLLKIKQIKHVILVLLTANTLLQDEKLANELLNKIFEGEHPFDYILAGEDKVDVIMHSFDSDTIANGIIVGDLPSDVQSAQILKIPCIGVTWGYSVASELETPFHAHDPEELVELINDHVLDILEDYQKDDETEIPFDEEIEFSEEV